VTVGVRLGEGRRTRRRGRRFVVGLFAIALTVGISLALVAGSPSPSVTIVANRPGIGPATTVSVEASEPGRGLGRISVSVTQGVERAELAERRHEVRAWWKLWGRHTVADAVEVEVGARHQTWLVEGTATVTVVIERGSLPFYRPSASESTLELPVRLTPPAVTVVSPRVTATQGGSGAVVYRVEAGAVRHGVAVGDAWFPGADRGASGESFALFAVPWDVDDPVAVTLVAEDALGNSSHRVFLERVIPHPPALGTINLSAAFLARVVPPIVARTPGLEAGDNDLATYLSVNGDLRRDNRAQLLSLGELSRAAFLWRGAFQSLPHGQVMSPFAVRRTYRFEGEPVDEQVHLGYDLASVRQAAVPAANAGVVLFSDYLGIYGNAVVLDHGYGLMSLYAHLSSASVRAGETVVAGQELGRTGTTGLAGGDHLHFATLLRGVPVDPKEWWDPHWIETRIAAALGDAFPGASEAR